MEFSLDIGTIFQAFIGVLIAVIAWLAKSKVNNIENNIKKLSEDLTGFKETQLRECSDKRQELFNCFYKQDVLDERKEAIDNRLDRLEGLANGKLKQRA